MRTAVVVCPGRGTYGKGELGSLARHFPDAGMLAKFDARRTALGQQTLTALDGAAAFSTARHTRGDNASGLIYACSLGDYLSLRDVRVVAVTGNSMGWYTALGCAGALSPLAGFEVANTMGRLMHQHAPGGQVLVPCMSEDWRPDPARKAALLGIVAGIAARPDHALALSIDLGGVLVLAGDAAGLAALEAAVPAEGRIPMRLPGHAAFHTALMEPVAAEGRACLGVDLFGQPTLPMIDGRGAIWWPGEVDPAALHAYTLDHQVTRAYDFTAAIRIAAREFAPDLFIVPGPGTTLGGAVAQALILCDWRGMRSKADFRTIQKTDPLLVSMGMPDQRATVTGATP